MIEQEIFYVSIIPPPALEANLIKEASFIINKDLYGTRIVLAGKIPRIIAHFNNVEAADSAAHRLGILGLKALVCRDSEIRETQNGFKAHALKLDPDDVLFSDASGKTIRIGPNNAFLIISGRIQSDTKTASTETKSKLNLGATLLTGGIPIWRSVSEKTDKTTVQTEYFVRLYDRALSEPLVEIVHNDFDYSFLAGKIAPSSFTNFKALVANIRSIFPKAIFDERLTELFGADVPYSTPWESANINCRLICLHYQAVSGSSPSI